MNQASFFSLNLADLYILCWCIYYQQEALFSSGGLIFQGVLIVLLLMSLYFAFQVITKYKTPIYFKGLNMFLGVMVIYGLLLTISGEKVYVKATMEYYHSYDYLKLLLTSLLPIYSFFYFGEQGYITKDKLTIYVIIFIALAVNQFFYSQEQILATRSNNNNENFEVTNNVGYIFVSIIPLIALVKRNLIKYVSLCICVAFAYLSVKRGAIVTSTISLLLFLLMSLKSSKRGHKFVILIVIFAIAFGLYYFVLNILQNNALFLYRLESTQSGEIGVREKIFSDLWEHFLNNRSLLSILFGNGAFATAETTINFAHNDWLEILTDQGLLGVIIYVFYWLCFYKTWRKNKMQNSSSFSMSIILFMFIFFIKTFFSMSFINLEIPATLALGYSLSQINNNQKTNFIHNKLNSRYVTNC